jgi:hypothetical protein
MHFPLFFVSLLAATIFGAFATSSPLTSHDEEAWDECEAHMNGQLPYYVPESFHFSGNVRRYYVAAEIEPWDYAPTGMAL